LIPMLPSQLAGSHFCCALCQVKDDIGWFITGWLMGSVRGFYLKAE
jgi:hypothetical protein